MRFKSLVLLGIMLLAAAEFGLAARSARAAITLEYFTAAAADPVINIDWKTGTEFDTAGFYVGRGTSVNGPFTHIPNNYTGDPSGYVPATGGTAPATYDLIDQNVQRGILYYYRLEEISCHGSCIIYHEPIVTATIAIVVSTNTPTRTRTPTPTATLTSTPTPTSTSAPEMHANHQPFTPTPRASGLDPSVFTRVTQAPTDSSSASEPPTAQPTEIPTSPANGAAPSPLPTAQSTVTGLSVSIPPSSVPRLTNFQSGLPTPAPGGGALVAMAPMIVGSSDEADSSSAPANGPLFSILLILALALMLGVVYALRRQAHR